jgi:signal transduction histidine kinase
MKGGLHIPRNRVHLDEGVLSTKRDSKDFVRDMTHEIRTPLNVIVGLCQYLERDREAPLTNAQRDIVVRMERNAQALLQSVTRLLESVRTGEFK